MKMKKKVVIFCALLLSVSSVFGQVVKTAAVPYTKGSGFSPNINTSSELRVDTSASALYWWDRDALTWMRFRPGVDVITGSSAPAYTPRDNQSLFAVNADSELWYYDGAAWVAPFAGALNLGNSDLIQDDPERLFSADSTQVFAMGQFPLFPSMNFDGTEKGYYSNPEGDGIVIINGDGVTGGISYLNAFYSGSGQFLEYGTSIPSVGQVFSEENTQSAFSKFLKTASNNDSEFGANEFTIKQDDSDESFFRFYTIAKDTNTSLMLNFGTGVPEMSSPAFSISTNENFFWQITDLFNDTTGHNFSLYNRKYKFPNKYPNQTTAISDSTFLIAWKRNGTGPYDYTPIFVSKPMLGSGGSGGIYGGSGGVADGTVATLVDDFEFTGPDISSFTVTTGTTNGGQYFQNLAGATVLHRDTSGSSSLAFSGTGALFSFGDGATDRLTIGGRDARYSGDYSATYSARSLIDKGYADGAYLSDSDWTTAYSSATQSTSSWTATNAATDINAAIVPKGTGGVLADVPDGTSAGGNARGTYAVDLQSIRTNASDVASGNYSTIAGGRRCTASGNYSFAAGFRATASGAGSIAFGGDGSFSLGPTASGANSFAVGPGATASGAQSIAFGAGITATADYSAGIYAQTDKYGEFAGRSGWSFMQLRKESIVGTTPTELFLDGASLLATIPADQKWIVEIACLAEITVVGNGSGGLAADDVYSATFRCVIANKGGTTALVGTVQADMAAQSDATMSDATFTITADNTGDYLKVTYTGGANTGTTTQTNAYASLRVFKY